MISLNNFLATSFLMTNPSILGRADYETDVISHIHDENALLRARLEHISQEKSSFTCKCSKKRNTTPVQPIEITPPVHIVDDFYIIAQETLNVVNTIDNQVKVFKSIIKQISTTSSPVMGRKDGSLSKNKKKNAAHIFKTE